MSTFEIIVVFSALMALLALVSIGIDWIGKPLKHRRFIPKPYRFDDEKLPVDAYGRPTLDVPRPTMGAFMPPHAMAPQPMAPQPMAPQLPPASPQPTPNAPLLPGVQPLPTIVATVADAPSVDNAPPPADDAPPAQAPLPVVEERESGSTFSDLLAVPNGTDTDAAVTEWEPGMALDAPVNDERPSMALKAERFWSATAAALEETHFDHDTIERMRSGKAPRRRNPRTGRTENMKLTGLRRASARSDVRMTWPDDAVDPWAAS